MAKKEVMNECIEELVKAIILQAVEDYRMALRILAQDQEKTEEGTIQWAKRMKRDVEKFFCSGWFEMMSEADGKNILREVRAIERDQAIREGA